MESWITDPCATARLFPPFGMPLPGYGVPDLSDPRMPNFIRERAMIFALNNPALAANALASQAGMVGFPPQNFDPNHFPGSQSFSQMFWPGKPGQTPPSNGPPPPPGANGQTMDQLNQLYGISPQWYSLLNNGRIPTGVAPTVPGPEVGPNGGNFLSSQLPISQLMAVAAAACTNGVYPTGPVNLPPGTLGAGKSALMSPEALKTMDQSTTASRKLATSPNLDPQKINSVENSPTGVNATKISSPKHTPEVSAVING